MNLSPVGLNAIVDGEGLNPLAEQYYEQCDKHPLETCELGKHLPTKLQLLVEEEVGKPVVVNSCIYRLHSGLLKSRVGVFEALQLVHAPKGSDIVLEGRNDAHPICPPQVTQKEWEYLLKLIYDNLGPPPYRLEFLISILKIASQWDMLESRKWAIANISQLEYGIVPSALALKLGRHYAVDQWIRPAVVDLVRSPLRTLEEVHKQWLGFGVYDVIARTREALEGERKLLALVPMDIKSDDLRSKNCESHGECSSIWKKDWKTYIGQRLLNPNWMFSLHMDRVEGELRNVKFEGMDRGCLDTAITAVIESGALDIQDRYIDMALEMLLTEVPIEMSDVILPEGMDCELGIVE
ncbi:hypothetical protein PHLCEN_2v12401 [Hermanssonia centrifuga]|uniref:BTB domain-containing protein n=1 Tax=Hermanssonia centrifuga TaxID=98765 RepID=A0A2R6NH67_9APHY|nr:hypothetical protein PHLCEN_2v12401 [Hermanssonia centrifuga]